MPFCRSDVSWNFEKFVVDAGGSAVNRYSRHFLTSNIEKEIARLVK